MNPDTMEDNADQGAFEDGNNNEEPDDDDDDNDSLEDDDDDDDDNSDNSWSDDSSMGSDMEVESERLWDIMHASSGAGAPAVPPSRPKSPDQILQEHLTAVHDGGSNVLKLDDVMVKHIVDISESGTTGEEAIHRLYSNVLLAIQNSNGNATASAIASKSTIKQVILGTFVLQLWAPQQQTAIYQALAAHHSLTLTYCKLGTNDVDQLCGIPAESLLTILTSTSWPCLTEFQIRGIEFTSSATIDTLVQLLQSVAPTIKLFNIMGMVWKPQVLSSSPIGGAGLFDPVLQAVEHIPQLDEVQLHRIALLPDAKRQEVKNQNSYAMDDLKDEMSSPPPLVSSAALLHLLQVKPKWWRLALDGMGLQDSHLEVMAGQLVASKDCKMNDLLSIRNNPDLSSRALSQLYHVCINKQRMGLVLSDDYNLNALVDLVRPLNNLHRRLEYKDDQGNYSNAEQWLAWFQVISNLPWIDETRKLNYIWFTLLEQPSMIATAIHSCGGSSSDNNNR